MRSHGRGQRAVRVGALLPAADAFCPREYVAAPRNLDRWVASAWPTCVWKWTRTRRASLPPRDDADMLVRVSLVSAELCATGIVRAMQDVLHVTCLDAAAARGRGGRACESSRAAARERRPWPRTCAALPAAYARARTDPTDLAAVVIVTLATLAWDARDHSMRSATDVTHRRRRGATAYVHAVCADADAFDVRLCRAEQYAHPRRVVCTRGARGLGRNVDGRARGRNARGAAPRNHVRARRGGSAARARRLRFRSARDPAIECQNVISIVTG